MCDECTDAANREQLAVCIRWVDCYLEAHEEFIGLHLLENTSMYQEIYSKLEICVFRQPILNAYLLKMHCAFNCL